MNTQPKKAPEHNPLRKFADKPTRGAAIKAKCCECVGCTPSHLEPGFRQTIRECASFSCPLHLFRPFQTKE